MKTEPQTWHYGLNAQWWAEFNLDGPEIPYFQGVIERYGQPALDVACGTGRLLIPYLRAGLDVDGCDISGDMLALCRDKAEREGFAPRLYRQAMHELDLPRRYKTIFICGSFGIGGDRRMDQQALERFYHYLEPGGVLAIEHGLPYGNDRMWQYWLEENRRPLPRAWEPPGNPENRRRASDGTDYELRSRTLDLNPLEQTYTYQMQAERWRGEELLAQEELTLRGCLYFKNELLMMLERAGFSDVAIHSGYTEQEAQPEDDTIMFLARKG